MALSQVIDSDILAIWKRLNNKRRRVRAENVKFRVGQHVQVSKEIMNLAKGAEKNFSMELFRIAKVKKWTSTCVRARIFVSDTDRQQVLSGRTDSSSRHETCRL